MKIKKFCKKTIMLVIGGSLLVWGCCACEKAPTSVSSTTDVAAPQPVQDNPAVGNAPEDIVMFQETSQKVDVGTVSPEVVRSHLVLLDGATLERIITEVEKNGQPVKVQLNLFEDVNYVTELSLSKNTKIENSTLMEGTLQNVANSQVTMAVTQGVLSGNITLPGAAYQIRYVSDNLYSIRQIDQKKFPNPEEPVR